MSEKHPEDDYFIRLDQEKKAKLKAKIEAEQESTNLEERKRLHWHRCGKCGGAMDTHVFRGVEIEICSECGAVLLDQGELEQLSGEDRSGILQGIRDLFGAK